MDPQAHLQSIRSARDRVYQAAWHTPLRRADPGLSRPLGAEVYLKQELFQRTGSFKVRGAFNRISALDPVQAKRGVVAASAGNHAQGVAFSARWLGYPSFVFMPQTTPLAKVEATRSYGAEVVLAGDHFEAAVAAAHDYERQNKLIYVHGYDDWQVIHGAGIVGLEILEDLPEVEVLLCPVGGGGLVAGTALAAKALHPSIRIIGVQSQAAPAAVESFRARDLREHRVLPTIAEGIAVGAPGRCNLEVMLALVDDMVEVSDGEIADAILHLLEKSKLVCEGAGAASVAALLADRVPEAHNRKVAVILSGGNIDLHTLSTVITRGQAKLGRFLHFSLHVVDTPGALKRVVDEVSALRANIVEVFHNRTEADLPLGYVRIDIIAETRNREHGAALLADLRRLGYDPKSS